MTKFHDAKLQELYEACVQAPERHTIRQSDQADLSPAVETVSACVGA